jgi:nucleotidyltransferase/DNA polymerase involved in DNA repair
MVLAETDARLGVLMALTEQIPLQTKIAELEQRIERLERNQKRRQVTVTREYYSSGASGIFGEMYRDFREAIEDMKAAFR